MTAKSLRIRASLGFNIAAGLLAVGLATDGVDASPPRGEHAFPAPGSNVAAGPGLVGARPAELVGVAVAGVGDVNGDGRPDIAIGATEASFRGREGAGVVSLVLGGSRLPSGPLDRPGSRVIRIGGAAAGDNAGAALSSGDINGDGLSDVIVGAPAASNNGRTESGSTYVIFGSRRLPPIVDLRAPPRARLVARFDGAGTGDRSGTSVAGAGDVNGDGKDDLTLGALRAEIQGRPDAGAAYIILGSTVFPPSVDLRLPFQTKYVKVAGAAGGDLAGSAVAGAGDVNGDGFDDVLVGAPRASNRGRSNSGSAYLVLGQRTFRRIDLAAPSTATVVRFDGAALGDVAGTSVTGADVSGDGLSDVIVGAPAASRRGAPAAGAVFVIVGRTSWPSAVDLGGPASADWSRVNGAAAGHLAGQSVARLADVNGDRTDEVVLGAPRDWTDSPGAGAAYVLLGRLGTPTSGNLSQLERIGAVRVAGAQLGELAGVSVAGAGDMDGDGTPEVLVGGPLFQAGRALAAGRVRVIGFGPATGLAGQSQATEGSWARVESQRRFVPRAAPFELLPSRLPRSVRPATQTTRGSPGPTFVRVTRPQLIGRRLRIHVRARCRYQCVVDVVGKVVRQGRIAQLVGGDEAGTQSLRRAVASVVYRPDSGQTPSLRSIVHAGPATATLRLETSRVGTLQDSGEVQISVPVLRARRGG